MLSIILFCLSVLLYYVSTLFQFEPTYTIGLWTLLSIVGILFALKAAKPSVKMIGLILNGAFLLFSILLIIALFIQA
ncbi:MULTISPECIES: hypothetical protein [Shouchella]|uniref:DUF3953 domain-containing protein n=1 Tax=Shouchella clausii TaxID=79880 RepID=A0A268S4T5_SHOCL|nr:MULTISPECIES: hypothetical protein [Shouchella]PAD43311.1 hypothetical protein CHH54_07655 [Bacillus sp. 7520-S]AST96218.1 hypothetical protein BC8716_09770 [Shouchella clausii]MBU8598526.1 hypothetical protein [Shouchella clausii]MCY1104116.1 hypothetical protein [Shouchella clausii]MEB5473477.1 hypothetical protein [Shouchella clausii]